MPPKSKPNGYALFVMDQSRLNHIDPRVGFSKFHAEWNALDNLGKTYYKEKAKQLKSKQSQEQQNVDSQPPPTVPAFDLLSNIENYKNTKRPYPEEEDVDDYWRDGVDDEYVDFPEVPMVKKVCMVGDDTGPITEIILSSEHITVDKDEEVLETLTKDSELLQNVLETYRDRNEIQYYHAFVISCTPVIFAQGIKKGSNRPMNRPVEIAVSAFSVSAGVEKMYYHTFVYPGTIPEIETIHASESRAEFHGIPYDENLLVDEDCFQFEQNDFHLSRDYYDINLQVLKFMGFNGKNAALLPPLLCSSAYVGITEACFRWLAAQAQKQACSRKLPGLPQVGFGTLETFCQAVYWYLGPKMGTPVLCPDFDAFQPERGFHRQLLKLNCRFHAKCTTNKLCALGATQEACYQALYKVGDIFGMPKKEPFVYLGRDIVEDEIRSEGC